MGDQSTTECTRSVDLVHGIRNQSDTETKVDSSHNYVSTNQDGSLVGSTQPWLESTTELDLFSDFESALNNFSSPVLATHPYSSQFVNSDSDTTVENELDQLLQLVDDDPNFNIDSFISV